MPIPPLHILSVLWLNVKKEKYFDPLALVISSSILDLEPFLVLIFDPAFPAHGFWHSYFAAFLVSILLSPILFVLEVRLRKGVAKTCGLFGLRCDAFPYSFKIIFVNLCLGTLLHVFFDSFTHRRFSYVLFPYYIQESHSNPFWFGMNAAVLVEFIAIGLSLLSCVMWVKLYVSRRKNRRAGEYIS